MCGGMFDRHVHHVLNGGGGGKTKRGTWMVGVAGCEKWD